MKKQIYFDYNATTPVDKRVLKKMLPFFIENFGNAHSKTHRYGWLAADSVAESRAQVAQLINCDASEIIFTSCATESINLAIKGIFKMYAKKGKHIVVLTTEHKAVLDCCEALKVDGAEISYIGVDREGRIELNELKQAIGQKTILVCAMLANNETGVIQDVAAIAEIVHAASSVFLCDATQAVGKIRVDVQELGIDLMPLSAHKMYGPKGAAALYVRRKNPRVYLKSILDGGGHENGLRSGTLNVPGIVGLGAACEIAENEMWDDAIRISRLRTKLEQSLLELWPVFVNGSQKHRLPNVSNLCFKTFPSKKIISSLPELALSAGAACSSALSEPSHVLSAMGLTSEDAKASIRFSLGKYTTEKEVDRAVKKLKAFYSSQFK
jgi:cysteine desulfurase